jgi:D-2-hydroxyacid dehydrogenase (NADP+)
LTAEIFVPAAADNASKDRFQRISSMTAKVLVVDGHPEIYRQRLQAEFPALQFLLARHPAALPADAAAANVLISFAMGLKDEFFRDAKNLQWIQCLATGVDHLFRYPSLRPEVLLTSGRGIHGAPMRETVVYLMMGVSRGVARLVEDQKVHVWDRRPYRLFSGKTAIIVGVGVVGSAIGRLLQAFGMHVVGLTRTPRAVEGFDETMPTARLQEAAGRADFLINVLPATADNVLLFNAAVFAAMKPSAYYISAGRGQTVDETALVTALRDGKIAGAGLDVFQTEPLPPDSPFWDLPSVFITPHLGGYTSEYEDLIMPLIIGNMRAFLAGRLEEMRNIVKQ